MFALARVAVLRTARDRTNLFFVVMFPLLIVLLVGLQFGGGGTTRVGIVDGAYGAELRSGLSAAEVDVEVVDLEDPGAARTAVENGDVDAALLLPDEPVEVAGDDTVEIAFIANPDGSDLATRSVIQAVVADLDATLRAERTLLATGVTDDRQTASELVAGTSVTGPEVSTTSVGEEGLAAEFAGLGQFDLGASTQLLLFVFLTAMTGSAAVVQARRWRILDRVLAGPTSATEVVAGLGLGQLLIAGLQAVIIVVATTAVFGVDWGDPLASTTVVVVFSLVGAAAGLLLGALLRNEEQVGGVGVPLSLALAAIGGSKVPLEIFPDTLRAVANLTPHAWGNMAFAEIVRRDGTLVDVLPQVGVLLGFAVVLGVVASWTLRHRLSMD